MTGNDDFLIWKDKNKDKLPGGKMKRSFLPIFKVCDKEKKTEMIQKENKQASNLKLADVQLAFQSVLQMRSFQHSVVSYEL